MGHTVACLDPFDLVGGKDTLNPLDCIGDAHDPHALDDCASLANSLIVREPGEKDRHWNDSAELFTTAMLGLVAAEGEDVLRSIQSIRPLLASPVAMAKAAGIMQASGAWDGSLARLGHQLTLAKDKELASVLTTTNRHLKFLDTPAVIKNTRESSFDPSDLCGGKMTVYLVLPPKYQRSHAALMRMWLNALMQAVISNGLSERRVHLVVDEAASLGNIPILFDALGKYRGYGVRLQLYYQSMGQLKECWPNGADQTLLSNTSKIFFAVNDPMTAEYVSKRLGSYTAVADSWGASEGGSASSDKSGASSGGSRSWGTSSNLAQVQRPLLTADEVMSLHPRQAITFPNSNGLRPILSWLSRYYEPPARRLSTGRVIVDAFCVLFGAVLFAAWATGMALKHTR